MGSFQMPSALSHWWIAGTALRDHHDRGGSLPTQRGQGGPTTGSKPEKAQADSSGKRQGIMIRDYWSSPEALAVHEFIGAFRDESELINIMQAERSTNPVDWGDEISEEHDDDISFQEK